MQFVLLSTKKWMESFCDDEMEDKRADYEMMEKWIKWRADQLFPWISRQRSALMEPSVPSRSFQVPRILWFTSHERLKRDICYQ